MSERVTGYGLLISGVVLMLFSLASVLLVFTGTIPPVKLFNYQGISFDLGSMLGVNLDALQNPGGPTTKPATKPAELIPGNLINDTSNLFAHLMLMGFLASIGFKLAQLGVQMLRPIVVKLKVKDGTEIPTAK